MRSRSVRNLVLALGASALAGWAQHLLAGDHLRDGLIVYAVAGVVFAWVLRRQGRQPAWDGVFVSPSPLTSQRPAWRRWAVLVTLALSIALAIVALNLFGEQVDLPRAWRFHLASIPLFLLAVYLLSFRSPALPSSRSEALPISRTANRKTLLALALILVLAAFVRLYHLDTIPSGVWYDEADNGLQVRHMIQNPEWRPVHTNLPTHFSYMILFSFKRFGETPLAMRLVTTLLGWLTVPAAYLAGRELFPNDRRLALVLAFFLAVSRWDVNWSRIALHGISVPLFELLGVGLLLRALRTGKLTDFAWAGVAVGLGPCFYTPLLLFPVVLGLFLIVWFLGQVSVGQVVARVRAVFVPFIVFSVAALLTVGPLLQFAFQESEVFWKRPRQISVLKEAGITDRPQAVAQNAVKHILMFNYEGDPNGRHNLPGEPMLDPITGVLFAVGLLVSLGRLAKSKYLLLVLWLGITLISGVLSVTFEAPQSLRAIGSMPAAYALAVVPLEMLLVKVTALFRRFQPRRVIQVALAVLLGCVGWSNFYTYFYRQTRDFAVWNAFATAETRLAREIQRLRDDYDLYFDPLLFRHLTTQFLLPDFNAYMTYDPATVFPVPDPTPGKKGVGLFVSPESRSARTLFQVYYPDVALEEFAHPYGGPTVLSTYLLAGDEIAATHGLVGRYYGADDDLPRFQRTDSAVDFDWTSEEPPLEFPFRVDWQGALDVPTYGAHQLSVQAPGGVELWLDQAPVPLDGGSSPVLSLPAGVHALRLVCHVERPAAVRLLWHTPADTELKPVPVGALYHEPFTGHGLVGHYYANDSWTGSPAFSRIDPVIAYYFHHIPLARPYTVEWKGRLEIPRSGRWALGTEALSATWLDLDGREVLANTQINYYEQVELDLSAGWHDIVLRFLDAGSHSHVYLWWRPPEGVREIIPTQYLYPPAKESWVGP